MCRVFGNMGFHFIENGVYKEFRIPASDYVDYADLKRKAGCLFQFGVDGGDCNVADE